jgi:ribosomal protein L29
MESNNSEFIYQVLTKELNKLGDIYLKLSDDIQKINIETSKLDGLETTLDELVSWKSDFEKTITLSDISNLKSNSSEISDLKKDIAALKATSELKDSQIKDLNKEVIDLKEFKIRATTIGYVVAFLYGLAMTIIGWVVS